MRKFILTLASVTLLVNPVWATDPASCKKVKMAEPGWNDLSFTTGVAQTLFNALGYEANSSTLSIEIIYASMKNKELDVFLGYWDPAMITYYKPYKEDGSVETIVTNLTGAKYTFAVPTYVWDAGVKDFADLTKFSDKFNKKMYGIEAGSNQLMFDAIADPTLKLEGWEVVESSEAAMLTEVGNKIKNNEYIVFQGWAPHPMNSLYDFKYLTGGDKFFGPNFGASTVSTQVRKDYTNECPNAAQLLKNLKFDIELENKGIGYLINDGLTQGEAALKAINEQQDRLPVWLDGVTAFDGSDGQSAVKNELGL